MADINEEGSRSRTVESLKHYRDEAFAVLVLGIVRLVAESHPDLLRDALAGVFDLKAIERDHRRVLALQDEARQRFQADRELLMAIQKDVERIEGQIDALHYRLDRLNTLLPENHHETPNYAGTNRKPKSV